MNKVTEQPLNIKQAAEFLGLKPSYIYNLVFFGKLPAYKPGGKKLFFKPSELEKYAYGQKRLSRAERAALILNNSQKRKASRRAGA